MAVHSSPETAAPHRASFPRLLCLCAAIIILTPSLGCSLSAEANAVAAETLPDSAFILMGMAEMLGWQGAPYSGADLPGRSSKLTADGTGALGAAASVTEAGERTLLDDYEERGMSRGLYRGREAIIVHPGDPLCPRDEEQSAAVCAPATGGLIAWRHGPYALSAWDDSGTGRESAVAEALWRAAEQVLGSIPGTVVILADTEDTPGSDSLLRYRSLAQSVDRYYALNAYGRVDLASTFMDADGDAGDEDWYTVGPRLASYAGREGDFAVAAVQAAFAGSHLPRTAYSERIIVVCPATSSPLGNTRNLFSAAYMKPPTFAIEVRGAEHETSIYVASLVVVSEEDEVGSWVHEIGHTLYGRHRTAGGHRRISDRYGEQQGHVGPWDLMSTGSRWGSPEGSLPVHMSSFTKEAAGWLHLAPAAMDQTYNLLALENQKIGDSILTVDDPTSDDPRCFYIIEARDGQAFYGAPETGVMLYHVAPDAASGGNRVDLMLAQASEARGQQSGVTYERPTLHGAASPEGAREYIDAEAGFRITLVAESFAPYVATVRIEHRARAAIKIVRLRRSPPGDKDRRATLRRNAP